MRERVWPWKHCPLCSLLLSKAAYAPVDSVKLCRASLLDSPIHPPTTAIPFAYMPLQPSKDYDTWGSGGAAWTSCYQRKTSIPCQAELFVTL